MLIPIIKMRWSHKPSYFYICNENPYIWKYDLNIEMLLFSVLNIACWSIVDVRYIECLSYFEFIETALRCKNLLFLKNCLLLYLERK